MSMKHIVSVDSEWRKFTFRKAFYSGSLQWHFTCIMSMVFSLPVYKCIYLQVFSTGKFFLQSLSSLICKNGISEAANILCIGMILLLASTK